MPVVLRKNMSVLQDGVLRECTCTRDAVLLFRVPLVKTSSFPSLVPRETI